MNTKFKDRSPYETVRLIKDYMLKKEIMVSEVWYENNSDLYSVALRVEGTAISVNGKGTSKIYALASGYGELVERLFTFAPFRMKSNIFDSDAKNEEKGVYFADEVEYINSIYNYLKLESVKCDNTENLKSSLEQFCVLKSPCSKRRMCLYNNVDSSDSISIPFNVVDLIYGSNGMVAGNSKEEAFVQGLSEILERYVIKKCITERLTPPNICLKVFDSLENINEIKRNIDEIEKSGRYKIVIKDLSLGKNIPALAIILYDKKESRYLVKVGVHPRMEIALERCFTELLQGQYIDRYRTMMDVRSCSKKASNIHNIISYYVNGHGHLPVEFFRKDQPSFNPITVNRKIISNMEMSNYLIGIIESLNFKIYYHDFTKMDIYCYHILIPGMSEYGDIDKDYVYKANEDYKISRLIRKGVKNLTADETKIILDYIKLNIHAKNYPTSKLLFDFRLNQESIYQKTPIAIYEFYLYIVVGDFENALRTIRNYNTQFQRENKIYNCCEDYLVLLLNYKKEDILLYLTNFYSEKEIQLATKLLNAGFSECFHEIKCNFNCDTCDVANTCLEKEHMKIYNKIKG